LLFSERKRQTRFAELEAAGESLWTSEFNERSRTAIWQKFALAFNMEFSGHQNDWRRVCEQLRRDLLVGLKVNKLNGKAHPAEDVDAFLQSVDDEIVCSIIEAMGEVIKKTFSWNPYFVFDDYYFFDHINDLFYEERLAFELVEGQVIERATEELHSAVVSPTLRLLAGRKEFGPIETAYRNALEEIADGKADDAITDAASALQETFLLLGCQGNALGPLIKDARSKGLLAPHDPTLAEAISKIADWTSAARSQMGDGHRGASAATRDDAWLTVHVVGALILRLATTPRGSG